MNFVVTVDTEDIVWMVLLAICVITFIIIWIVGRVRYKIDQRKKESEKGKDKDTDDDTGTTRGK